MRPPPPCAIINPNAGTATSIDEMRGRLEDCGFEVRMTVGPGDATQLAAERAAAGVPTVVACGGDGTISEVARGIIPVRSETRLGVIPLGTGNDLARTLSIPTEFEAALETLLAGRERALDVIVVEPDDADRSYAINVAAGGFSGQVDEVLTSEAKARWGPLAYVFSAARVLPDLTGYETKLSFDDGESERIEALNVIVANARTCGGGMEVAPCADPEDGLLDVVVVRWGSALDLARVGMRLMKGDYVDGEDVVHRRARAVRVTSKPPMWFNVDGELISRAAVTFRVMPRALRVIVGADYRSAPSNRSA